ncbi:non-specific ribonucleoside hydrolase RihC-like isoform X3 [Mercenaria mercenaria]|uniref:non-specific ribonucleoside hydrolase RihC-like isoform X3 n=1 Tax=Mercenaria mercenaria TaxID=6596 RepID=UPI00234EA1CA|nr:non-specific ribonucleoside hydrolase RihC-like isoform X3 [Mercenaria mercenaria]
MLPYLVPVYRGSNIPLVDEGIEATHYHGNDGLGDADLDTEVTLNGIQKENAVSALLRLVNEYPGEITLVALAPLTNIAVALKQDCNFGKKLKRISIMGGNTQGRGNSTLCGEFNFACDPDAAFVVLNELCVPVTLFPWEINLTAAAGHPWDWFDEWIETDTLKGKFNKAVTKLAVYRQREVNKNPIYRSCDLNAIATVINPKIILETKDVFATVELHGKYTRGMMVVDWRGSLGKSPNVTLVDKIDTRLARPLFEHMLK